jgi:hypothetical protein
LWPVELQGTVYVQGSRIGEVGPIHDLDQGGFSGAVLADQGVDLPALEGEGNIVQALLVPGNTLVMFRTFRVLINPSAQ